MSKRVSDDNASTRRHHFIADVDIPLVEETRVDETETELE